MLAPRIDVMDPFLKAELLATAQDLLDDAEVRTSITLKGLVSQTVDLETGLVTPTENEDSVNALARTVDEAEAARSEGAFRVGDRVYLIEQSDLTSGLDHMDTIVDGTNVYDVVRWSEDPLGWLYQIVGRRT